MTRLSTFANGRIESTGSYLLGKNYLIWRTNAQLSGLAIWGQPEPEQMASMTRALDHTLVSISRSVLVDIRRVESVNSDSFDVLARYVEAREGTLRKRITAQALLRPSGLVGVIVAGFYEVLAHSYPIEVFTVPNEALLWLGTANERATVAEIDRLVDDKASIGDTLCALRIYLRRNPSPNLDEVAASLGLSVRCLQRKLRDSSSCFRAEQNAAQVHLAKRLMLTTHYDIKQIAFEVGCSSMSGFSALFRRIEGQSPSGWRNQARSASSCEAQLLSHI